MSRAIALAEDFRPHVAIVDLRLLDEYSDDRSGLQLLEGLRSASRILYSAYLTPELTLEVVKRYNTKRWVSKHQSPQQLLDEVSDAASQTFRRDLTVHRPGPLSSQRIVEALFGHSADVPLDLVDDTLGQLFSENQGLTLRPLVGAAVSPFSVSRGRSVVSKAHPDNLEPVVVKLAPAKQTRNEERNYQEHVKGRLVGQFYAQLERTVEFWDLGAARYSFLGSSLRALPSFAASYRQEKDPQNILKPLIHFFKEVWSNHYGRPISWDPPPLFQVYDRALGLKERLESFSYRENTLTFPGLPVSFENPVLWALEHSDTSLLRNAQCAVTHGDMHGDNLFVDGEHSWAIDFERTGPGHILRDFVELEVDILTRLVPFLNYDLSRFYELVTALMEPSASLTSSRPRGQSPADAENHKALEVITGLRRLAYEVTQFRDFREYLWGLLLDALFVATLVSRDSPQRERSLLLAAVICESLQGWE
jgi:hypothetical protein